MVGLLTLIQPIGVRIPVSQLRYIQGGRLAQLVERLAYTEDVGSSSLSPPTTFGLEYVVTL